MACFTYHTKYVIHSTETTVLSSVYVSVTQQ
jgi:hypothetical protein